MVNNHDNVRSKPPLWNFYFVQLPFFKSDQRSTQSGIFSKHPSTTVRKTICRNLTQYSPCACRSQWPSGQRRRSAAACLLRSWVQIPPGAWMFVCCELSGRGLCDEMITCPEEYYRLWCVVVCDLENLKNEEAMTSVGSQRHDKKKTVLT